MVIMINFDRQRKTFCLRNRYLSYWFYVNEANILQHLFLGSPLADINLLALTNLDTDWSRTYLDKNTNLEGSYQDAFYDGKSMMEIPGFGYADKRGASFIIEDSNKNVATDFRYVSHRIYQGKPLLSQMPCFRDEGNVQTLEITLQDLKRDITLLASYTIYEDYSLILRNNQIINNEEQPIIIRRAYSLNLDLPSKDYSLIHFPGDWCNERREVEEEIDYGLKRLYSNLGRSSHEENPFAFIKEKDAGEYQGTCYAFSFVYSGNFAIDINVDKLKMTRVQVGINDEQFDWNLASKQSFVTPEGLIVYSAKGINGLTQTIHDITREKLINKHFVNKDRPIMLNSWEGCYMDFNTEKIIRYIDDVVSMGAELFVLDDGWFGQRNDDNTSLGDWTVNTQKIDLKRIIEHCHSLGLKFGLWFEPEMINPQSDLFRHHPEFALGDPKVNRSLSRHQLVLDTANKAAIDNVYSQIITILDNYDIDYVKWDHNRNVADAFSLAVSNYQQGEVYHRLMLGSYELINRIVTRYPNILFESCASGGGRFDLGMLYYMPQVWTSDEMDPLQRLFIQYSTSRLYPLSTMGAHVGKHNTASYSTKAKISCLGIFGYEFDPKTLDAEQKKAVLDVASVYKRNRNLIYSGDVYHLLTPYKQNYMSLLVVSKDKRQGLCLFSNLKKENIEYRFLKLKGLDPQKKYFNSFDHQTYFGSYYMDVGINLCKGLTFLETYLIEITIEE